MSDAVATILLIVFLWVVVDPQGARETIDAVFADAACTPAPDTKSAP